MLQIQRRSLPNGCLKIDVKNHRGGTWVLMDFGSLVVHVFTAEARKFYDLERLWQDGYQVNLSAVLGENA